MKNNACFHCGDTLPNKPIETEGHSFCCNGCANVYQLLNQHLLDAFYQYEPMAGSKPRNERPDAYAFLDLEELRSRYITFQNEQRVHLNLSLPSIHCSSCIYLLENLNKINSKVLRVQVHFARKQASIVIDSKMALSELANLLNYIGYPPDFSKNENNSKKHDRTFLFQLGTAGFAFGSIMLWSTPDYFGLGKDNPGFRNFSAYLSLLASIPVLLFSARGYLISAYKAIRSKAINLDVPISIGILALYLQSLLQILNGQGAGYMDSFAGFIFFLLIGKWFQNITYASLSFDRDFTSFFPVAIQRINKANHKDIVPIEALQIDDLIEVRNEEIIPCDSELSSANTYIDYSFVTGESLPVLVNKGDLIYAGGKIQGVASQMIVKATSNRSHLTQLWNETKNKTPKNQLIRYQDRIAQYFLIVLLLLALSSGIFWCVVDKSQMMKVIVALLIVACPCALALSAPFTLGNALRVLGKIGLYLKNVSVVESLTAIDTIVLDKTGTLTDPNSYELKIKSNSLNKDQFAVFVNMARQSTHPLSRALALANEDIDELTLEDFQEIKGQGLSASYQNQHFIMGSAAFVGNEQNAQGNELFLNVDSQTAHIQFESKWRTKAIGAIIEKIGKEHLYILSGDQPKDSDQLIALGFSPERMYFGLNPGQKSDQIKKLQSNGRQVLFIGDGLNDVGALGTAEIGIALSEDMFRFTPSCDAILEAKFFSQLPQMIEIGRYAKRVLQICLAFSLLYNLFGLSIAFTGQLTPLIAAILMPISSITIVILSTVLIQLKFKRLFKS